MEFLFVGSLVEQPLTILGNITIDLDPRKERLVLSQRFRNCLICIEVKTQLNHIDFALLDVNIDAPIFFIFFRLHIEIIKSIISWKCIEHQLGMGDEGQTLRQDVMSDQPTAAIYVM